MNEARELIAAFLYINKTNDRGVAHFIPSLIGLFGSVAMLDQFLGHLDTALADQSISQPLKERAANLVITFIPQVAHYNGLDELPTRTVTPEELKAISADTLESRSHGLLTILVALRNIFEEVTKIG